MASVFRSSKVAANCLLDEMCYRNQSDLNHRSHQELRAWSRSLQELLAPEWGGCGGVSGVLVASDG